MTMANDIIEAFPAKRFFVEMLTRDIELQDAILDLLDNCLDGALRSISSSNEEINEENKYHGFYSKINFNEDGFTIEDNCGGISGSLATSYAFRMGRPNERDIDNIPTIGVYGIGMKRAIFKLGTSSQVLSKTKDEEFKVTISPEWLSNDKNWKLDLERGNVDLKTTGVKIIVNDLRDDVKNHFKVDRD
ncbi:ATP-binding protein, partial [Escherichia coli]|nr:ATP-binding protein [Escherichia coli]